MELIGVTHDDEYLNDIYAYVYTKYPNHPKSMLLELSENTDEIVKNGFVDSFFYSLAESFRIAGAEIIYGDLKASYYSSKLDNLLDYCLMSFDAFSFHKRDKNFTEKTKKKNPEVVILGGMHAAYIRPAFPEAEYTVWYANRFDYFRLGTLVRPISMKYKRPDNVFLHNKDGKRFIEKYKEIRLDEIDAAIDNNQAYLTYFDVRIFGAEFLSEEFDVKIEQLESLGIQF